MDKLKNKLLDILLFPARLYEGLTDRKATLIAGIVLVGAIDFLLPDVKGIVKELFLGKSAPDIVYNAGMAALVLMLLGFIDVIFVSVPLFDIAAYLKRKEARFISETGIEGGEQQPPLQPTVIKVMKAYVILHFLVIPVQLIINYAIPPEVFEDGSALLQNLSVLLFMLIMIWGAAILTRGINSIFRFGMLFRRLIFIIVFTWQYIFGMVFDLLIINWLMQLFR
ncbi:MAG TPA: hypothetical protein PK127_01405 [Clostridiales bacterium]|nr:hypothetical protein [Clostridiales bacterium]HPV01122.1 hypothetical protein [Clostridiales bacterium]